MKEALLYEKLEHNSVRCNLCAHRCVIRPGKRGVCLVRENIDGTLFTNVFGRSIAQHVDPVEKKPLYHFYPGSKAFSIATPGCNFHCRFCQNWDISQIINREILESGYLTSPAQIVRGAKETHSTSIAYTYTEPTIFFEYSYETAHLAHNEGLKNIYVSNGYMTFEMLEMIGPVLDAINIDLKAFRDDTYRRYIGARLQPVLDNLKKVKQMGIWLEVTSLIIPGINDDPGEMREMANFVAEELGRDVPWHISRFFPAYKMKEIPPTPAKTLFKAREIGLESGLRYVYIGNLAGTEEMNTKCPKCGLILIERSGYRNLRNIIVDGKCPECGTKIAGIGFLN
ncbi:MAG: AmmeMemoRadiSam system radical SAM enzyme [Bacteroidales bacterium]|nr:AmmeMemoRadiSam system radical SAM enzyme [Bacteroidales bacterium]